MNGDLDSRLLAAHADGNHDALIRLYAQAAQIANSDTACGFYLTHAYVFALESGDARAPGLRARLVEMGRESRDG